MEVYWPLFKKEKGKMTGTNSTPKTQILIVSYSYSGNTHRIARGIQELTGGDRYEIYTWQPYPMAFPELLKQVKKEVDQGYHPILLSGAPSPAMYQVIFAGSPNWCGSIAPPLSTWLYKNDFSEKLILPFYSHCGGVPADFRNDIKKICPGSDVREPLNVIEDGGEQLNERIEKWIGEIKLRTAICRMR
jgi:flavodoxin